MIGAMIQTGMRNITQHLLGVRGYGVTAGCRVRARTRVGGGVENVRGSRNYLHLRGNEDIDCAQTKLSP
jgi:hypothetical protein